MQHTTVDNINHDNIDWPKVKKFLADYGITHASDFAKLTSICYDPHDPSYLRHVKTFEFNHDIHLVWDAYKNISPAHVWSGSMIRFGLQYARYNNSITYPNTQTHDGLQAGQVLILNLCILNGMINICVGHEVMEVNETEKLIRICYLENAASQGSQFIRLSKTGTNGTLVTHETFYKSNSWFRDRILYPGLHTKALKEFHGNVGRYLEEGRAD
ncbi:MAG: hypothetical protein KF803_12120 [Cyclobacteriaceae bacterium]|nr:hypothetical protein [Cyclobacteriaceae bacterium]